MRIPRIEGIIKRRILANFRADPEIVQNLLPPIFRPKLHGGNAIVGVCLIRLEKIRPFGLPEFAGISSENAAHRFAVNWVDDKGEQMEGVFIARRETNSLFNHLTGGRVFPGEHSRAKFKVSFDGTMMDFKMESRDRRSDIRIKGIKTIEIPKASCFCSVTEASEYFKGGSTGYSVTKDPGRLDGINLVTKRWEVSALEVSVIHSAYYSDETRFPKGSIQFDNALLMENIAHEWQSTMDMHI